MTAAVWIYGGFAAGVVLCFLLVLCCAVIIYRRFGYPDDDDATECDTCNSDTYDEQQYYRGGIIIVGKPIYAPSSQALANRRSTAF